MGLRFQKRIKIFPGVYINLSKSGVSALSVGGQRRDGQCRRRRAANDHARHSGHGPQLPRAAQWHHSTPLIAVAVLLGLAYLITPDSIRRSCIGGSRSGSEAELTKS